MKTKVRRLLGAALVFTVALTMGGTARADVHVRAGANFVATANFTVIAEKGSTVTAEGGSHVIAEDGSIVYAKSDAVVDAKAGSNVFAEKGSQIDLYDGATVNAPSGPTVHWSEGCMIQGIGIDIKVFKGAVVQARLKSKVVACEAGAIVYACDGSNVTARSGSTVSATPKAEVVVEAGSHVDLVASEDSFPCANLRDQLLLGAWEFGAFGEKFIYWFKRNGCVEVTVGGKTSKGSYSISGKILSMTESGKNPSHDLTIDKLSKDELIIINYSEKSWTGKRIK